MQKHFIFVQKSRGFSHINKILIYAIHRSTSMWLSSLPWLIVSLTYPLCAWSQTIIYKNYQSLLFLAVNHPPCPGSDIPFSTIQSLKQSIFPCQGFLTQEDFSKTSLSLAVEASLWIPLSRCPSDLCYHNKTYSMVIMAYHKVLMSQ